MNIAAQGGWGRGVGAQTHLKQKAGNVDVAPTMTELVFDRN
jgi:hypothetical protein